jgi:hypothetical protein
MSLASFHLVWRSPLSTVRGAGAVSDRGEGASVDVAGPAAEAAPFISVCMRCPVCAQRWEGGFYARAYDVRGGS